MAGLANHCSVIRPGCDTMEVLAEGNMVMTAREDILTGSRVEKISYQHVKIIGQKFVRFRMTFFF